VNQQQLIELVGESWAPFLEEALTHPQTAEIKAAYRNATSVFPSKSAKDIFRAFKETPREKLYCIIVGQDPYPNRDFKGNPFATGIAFGVNEDQQLPKSLQIIDYGLKEYRGSGISDKTLVRPSNDGMLFLNAALTVEENKIGSHQDVWKPFVQRVLKTITINDGVAVVRMGKAAQKFVVDANHVIDCPHPMADFYNPGQELFKSSKVFEKLDKWLDFMYNRKAMW